jgi:hypothetical protein
LNRPDGLVDARGASANLVLSSFRFWLIPEPGGLKWHRLPALKVDPTGISGQERKKYQRCRQNIAGDYTAESLPGQIATRMRATRLYFRFFGKLAAEVRTAPRRSLEPKNLG